MEPRCKIFYDFVIVNTILYAKANLSFFLKQSQNLPGGGLLCFPVASFFIEPNKSFPNQSLIRMS